MRILPGTQFAYRQLICGKIQIEIELQNGIYIPVVYFKWN